MEGQLDFMKNNPFIIEMIYGFSHEFESAGDSVNSEGWKFFRLPGIKTFKKYAMPLGGMTCSSYHGRATSCIQ